MKYKAYLGALLALCLCVSGNTAEPLHGPVLHAVNSKELRDIMRRMNQLVYEREMTALQAQEVRQQHLQGLINTVSDLAVSAGGMTEAVAGFDLDEQELITFKTMAGQLLNEAQNIKHLAEEGDYPAVEEAYQRLDDTCNTCHRLFRF